MNGDAVGDLLIKWSNESGVRSDTLPPEARYVTGNIHIDSLIYQFESAAGVELTIFRDDITGYRVLDRVRWVEFVLRWA